MNYVGKPLAWCSRRPSGQTTPTTRCGSAFGNEATERDIEEFARRFECSVVDSFGSSEFAVDRDAGGRMPAGVDRQGFAGVSDLPLRDGHRVRGSGFRRARRAGQRRRGGRRAGQHRGCRLVQGYYNDAAANEERMRHGMYWSGDLAYRDADGWIYLAGRTADWMRVDGENLAAAPIERILQRLPAINQVAVYAVPDEHVGDQVMAAIVLQRGSDVDARASSRRSWPSQPDLSSKAWPRYVRINTALPQTATNKVLKRTLIQEGVTPGGGALWQREPRGRRYFVAAPESAV